MTVETSVPIAKPNILPQGLKMAVEKQTIYTNRTLMPHNTESASIVPATLMAAAPQYSSYVLESE